MKRRAFILSGAVAAGLGLSWVDTRAARAQTRGIRPLATGSALNGTTLTVVRAYPGAGRNQFLIMIRAAGRDRWHRLTLGEGAAEMLRAASTAGQLEGRLQGVGDSPLQVAIQTLVAGQRVSFEIGRAGQRLRGQVTTEPPADEPPSTTSALGFWGALVAIVAIFGLVAIVAMITGTPVSMRFRTRGHEVEIRVGEEALEPPSAGVMHDPICDTMPPMNC